MQSGSGAADDEYAPCGGCGKGISAEQAHTAVYASGAAFHEQCAIPARHATPRFDRRRDRYPYAFFPDNRAVADAPEWNALNAEFNALWKDKPNESRDAGKKALAMAERPPAENPAMLALSLKNLAAWYGREYFWYGQYASSRLAESLYLRALGVTEQLRGTEHLDVVELLTSLGDVLEARTHYLRAAPPRERALAVQEKNLGAEHADLAVTARNLARTYATLGRLDEARSLFTRALSIDERVLGPEHFDLVRTLNNLAHCADALGDVAEARKIYERSLAISEKRTGRVNLDAGWILGELAFLSRREGKKSEAELLSRRSRHYLREYRGPGVDGLFF